MARRAARSVLGSNLARHFRAKAPTAPSTRHEAQTCTRYSPPRHSLGRQCSSQGELEAFCYLRPCRTAFAQNGRSVPNVGGHPSADTGSP